MEQSGSDPILSVSSDNITLEATTGSSEEFEVYSNITWSVSGGDDWLSVSPLSGSNNEGITVTALSQNSLPSTRSVTLNLSGGGLSVDVLVQQSGTSSDPEINTSLTQVILGAESGSSQTVDVYSNIDWNVSCNVSWLMVSPATGAGNDSISIYSSSSNQTGEFRSGIVTVYGGNLSKQIVVLQDAVTSANEKSSNEPEIYMYPNPAHQEIYLECSHDINSKLVLQLYDNGGKLLLSNNMKQISVGEVIRIDVSHFAPGFYMVRLQGKEVNTRRTVVIE